MAGIGDSWGTREELLHPRGPDGRWIKKGGIAKGIIEAVLGFLRGFSPRTFQNQNQSSQYLHNISGRQGKKRFTNGDLRRLYDLPNANEDLRDGVIDNPSTGRFVEMMDRTETELPDDVILTRIVPTETFGYTRETATGTNSDTDPGIREMSGRLIADRGYSPMTIGNVDDVVAVPQGSVRMVVAAKKGTKVNVPGGSASDSSIFLTRDQPLRVTKIKPDGAGGWTMYVTTDESRKPGETPEAIGGPRGLQVPPTQEREAAIRDLGRISAKREGRPDEVAEQADIEARQRAAEANAQATPTPSPAQEAERRRVEALTQQPAPGEPPPRTEAPVGRVGEPGTPAPGGAPAQTPEATVPEAPTVPRRSVDLRLAVRDAKIPSPSAGSRRKQWNEAYLGVASGKKDPIDAIRELDSDIEVLRGGGEPGGGARGGLEEDRDRDIAAFQQLRDLMAREYGLPESEKAPEPRTRAGLPKAIRPEPVKTRLSKREQEAEERNRAAGEAEAVPAPTPVKAAPRKAAKKATGAPVAKKAAPRKAPAKAAAAAGATEAPGDLDQMSKRDLIAEAGRRGVTARESWTKDRIKQAMLDREAAGAQAPEAPGDDLDKMTKTELLAEAERRDVTVPKSWTKDKIKAALRDEGFRRPEKKTPEQRREQARESQKLLREFEERVAQGEGAPAVRGPLGVPNSNTVRQALVGMPADDRFPYLEDLLTPLNLTQSRRVAKDLGVRSAGRSEKPEIIAKIVQHFEGAGDIEAVARLEGPPAPVKKAAPRKLNSRNLNPGDRVIWERPGEAPVHGVVDQQGNRTFVNWEGGRRERVTSTGDGGMGSDVRLATPEEIEEHGTLSPPREEPRAPAAKVAPRGIEADRGRIPLGQSEAAPEFDTKNLKIGKGISATRIRPGDVVWVEPGKTADGKPTFLRTRRKTGSFPLTVTRNERESGNNYILHGTLPDGREVSTAGYFGQNTFMRVEGLPEGGVPAPAKKAAKAVPEGPSGHPGDTGMARALVPEAQERQVKLDRVKAYGTVGTEVDELLANGASPRALAHRIRTRGKQQLIPDDDLKDMLDAAEAGDNDRVRRLARGLMDREGITQIGATDDVVPLDRDNHQSLDRGGLPRDTNVVHVVRPGTRAKVDGDDVLIDRAVVEPANADEVREFEKSRRLVPEGSVPGTRTDTPVDNAPRKRELRQAWIAADIQPPAGPVRTQTHEIRDKLLAGEITPEESIRMMESEIALNKEDLAELDAHIREADLTDAEKREFQGRAAKLIQGIEAQEKASTFLRMYFKEEAPVVSLKEAKEVDPVSYEFLKDATPDDLKEAAKEAGLDAPSGDTPDEMFKDLIKQVAKKELDRKAAKKAAKKAAPAKVAKKAAPEVPRDKERVDARLLAEGIDLDDDMLDMVQRAFDGDDISGSGKNPSPAKIADALNGHARHQRDSTGIRFGKWEYGSMPRTPEEEAERQRNYDAGIARAQALEELAGRVRGVRRRSFKKAAPSTPEVAKLQDKVDDLEKRRIDDALGELSQSGDNRDRADAVLEGLTLPELRRLAKQSGVPTARTKRGLRDNILDRFVGPQEQINVDSLGDLPSREAAHELLAPLSKPELLRMARELSVPGAGSKNMTQLRSEIVEATTGRRLDSIAIRGFEGPSPEVPEPAVPRAKSLGRRVTEAGIDHPGRTFSDVDSAVTDADARLRAGESPTLVARGLRERAARVAKADIMEEGRRFPTELDRDTLLSLRKSNAEYLRRVATHVQQEAKGGAKGRPVKPGEVPSSLDELVERQLREAATPAKKAAPSAPEASDTSAEVKALRRRAEVSRSLAGMRQANNPPGSFHHNKGLQDEKEADRLDAEADALERGSAPAPAKKAPAKKAAPAKAAPSPSRTGTSPVGGTKSTAPEIKNNWGMLGTGGDVEFHDDGVIGQRLRQMGDDRLMDVDGEPLSNVIGKLATRAVRGEISQEQLLMDLDRLYKRLPAGSRAKGQVKSMMEDLDAPARPMPDLPEGTPAPFRTAIEKLLQIPLARDAVDRPGFHRDRENSEVDKLLRLLEEFNEGRTGGLRFINEIMNMRTGLPHESQEGRFEIDRVLRDLHAELDRMYKNPELRPQLMPRERGTRAPKKATPRLTAIPGGGTSRGGGKRPKLTVVRNEQGEFAVAWV